MVIASAVLSRFSSSWTELSDEKERVRFFAWTIGTNSSCETGLDHILVHVKLSIYKQMIQLFENGKRKKKKSIITTTKACKSKWKQRDRATANRTENPKKNLYQSNESLFPSNCLHIFLACSIKLIVYRIGYYKCRSLSWKQVNQIAQNGYTMKVKQLLLYQKYYLWIITPRKPPQCRARINRRLKCTQTCFSRSIMLKQ